MTSTDNQQASTTSASQPSETASASSVAAPLTPEEQLAALYQQKVHQLYAQYGTPSLRADAQVQQLWTQGGYPGIVYCDQYYNVYDVEGKILQYSDGWLQATYVDMSMLGQNAQATASSQATPASSQANAPSSQNHPAGTVPVAPATGASAVPDTANSATATNLDTPALTGVTSYTGTTYGAGIVGYGANQHNTPIDYQKQPWMQYNEPKQRVFSCLETVFGYEEFRSMQEEVVFSLLSGDDVLALMATGSGKSLCYQIVGLCQPGVTLVISPLISLMDDQVEQLHKLGIGAATLNHRTSYDEQLRIMAQLRAQQIKFLYVSPERVTSASFQRQLAQVPVCLIAIDEAHCISQWGHDFRPHYQQLASLRSIWNYTVPILAVTATARAHTRADIISSLALGQRGHLPTLAQQPWVAQVDGNLDRLAAKEHAMYLEQVRQALKAPDQELASNEDIQKAVAAFKVSGNKEVLATCSAEHYEHHHVYIGDFNRPNILIQVLNVEGGGQKPKDKKLLGLLSDKRVRPAIVYCYGRNTVERVCSYLNDNGYAATQYHAKLELSEREQNQRDFVSGKADIMVATIAFGMGINKTNVRQVIHYDYPSTIENYYQEIGRAGRDGKSSRAVLLDQKSGRDWRITMLLEEIQSNGQKLPDLKDASGEKLRQIVQNLITTNPETLLRPEKSPELKLKKFDEVLNFVDGQICRRRVVLGAFGQVLAKDCGKCDICRHSQEKIHVKDDLRKAMLAMMGCLQQISLPELVNLLCAKSEPSEVLERAYLRAHLENHANQQLLLQQQLHQQQAAQQSSYGAYTGPDVFANDYNPSNVPNQYAHVFAPEAEPLQIDPALLKATAAKLSRLSAETKVFGSGYWTALLEQLLALGYLTLDKSYTNLRITDQGVALLRSEEGLTLTKTPALSRVDVYRTSLQLDLERIRAQVAQSFNIHAEKIFPTKILDKIVRDAPKPTAVSAYLEAEHQQYVGKYVVGALDKYHKSLAAGLEGRTAPTATAQSSSAQARSLATSASPSASSGARQPTTRAYEPKGQGSSGSSQYGKGSSYSSSKSSSYSSGKSSGAVSTAGASGAKSASNPKGYFGAMSSSEYRQTKATSDKAKSRGNKRGIEWSGDKPF